MGKASVPTEQICSQQHQQSNMISKSTAFITALATAAHAAHLPAPYAPAPYHPAPIHPAPVHHPAPHGYAEPPKPYAFEYGVIDEYSGVNFGQNEASDGALVTGNYRVALPDGRIQIVDYHADVAGYGGYVADVKYEGVAHPGPAYKPAPIHPAPIHPAPIHPVHRAPIHPGPIHRAPVHPAPIRPLLG